MKSNKKSSTTATLGELGFTGALTILFIALKLLNVIHWSWIWVLSPIWIGLLIGLAALAIGTVAFLIYLVVTIVCGSGEN